MNRAASAAEQLPPKLARRDSVMGRSSDLSFTESSAIAEIAVRRVIVARLRRKQLFGADLFSDPAWDILLTLYASALGDRRIAVTNLSNVVTVPETTGLRWLEKLETRGLIVRESDRLDARRVWVRLSEHGLQTMHRYFE